MHSFSFSEEELRAAAVLSHGAFIFSLPEPGEYPEHRFSEGFVRKMEPLFALERRRRDHTVLRRVAAVFLTALIGLSAWLAIDTDARAAALKWIKEVFGNVIVYRLVDEPETEGKPSYVLTWIPEGLELVDFAEEELWYSAFYINDTGDICFSFDYSYTDDSQVQIITEPGQIIEKVKINGIDADFYPENGDDDTRVLVWIDEEHGVMLSIAGNLDKETILRIAENIKIEKK